jgi:hypothetical protein
MVALMKSLIAGTTAAAVGSLALLTGCRDTTRLEASGTRALQPSDSLLVQCGEGRQALVRTAQIDGRTLPQVECVAAAPVVESLGYATPLAQEVSYRAPALPIVEPAVQAPRVVYRERPAARRVAYREPVRRQEVRTWKKSALIIGGAAAGGAGLGAVIDGGKGAKKGAVIGGVAGTIYDLATRSKR